MHSLCVDLLLAAGIQSAGLEFAGDQPDSAANSLCLSLFTLIYSGKRHRRFENEANEMGAHLF